ncbi:MAG TPA: transglycosylase domain-containing protein [Microvirga sp.]|jgi:penicillin-binding protein 1A|nr:transglycosylase domain-containing protein [Microvirga sp.]
MIRAIGSAVASVLTLLSSASLAAEPAHFWDLPAEQLRRLVASPQVMVTRTETGIEAYCRCPVVLKPSEIPKAVKDAIVAVEDKRFFDHGGVDLVTLLSVLKGGINRGGSTIPMQLLKNLVFHDLRQQDILSRLERKGSEFWHAGSFDEAVGKEELLAAYLNQIEFGGREIVGLYRAARYYFRKEPKDLNLYEAAMLAGMVQAPARLNPLKEATRERAHERAKLVLRLMAEQGKITEAERKRAEDRGLRPGILPEFKLQAQAFTEWVVQSGASQLVRPGETVRFFVTLDPRAQQMAERHLDDLVTEGSVPPDYDASLVMMDPAGRVQAMVGSTDWSRRQFNAAVKAEVQPGSTAKLPLVVAACEAKRAPASRVTDLPILPDWPANGTVGYRGETTLIEAIAMSRNAAAVRLTRDVGVKAVADASRRLGVDPGPDPEASFVLGTFSTNPLAMTGAYAAVASGGYRVEPSGILAAVDGRGEVRSNPAAAERVRVIPSRCIEPTRQILEEVVRSGTGRGAKLRRWKAYGKTGTTSGNVDAWFIGWSEGRVLGIWMGKPRNGVSGTLAGAGAPADLFRRVMNGINDLDERRSVKPAADPQVAARPIPERTGSTARKDGVTARQKSSPEAERTSQVPLPPTRPRARPDNPWRDLFGGRLM